MRETRSSGSVEGVVGNHDPYSDSGALAIQASPQPTTHPLESFANRMPPDCEPTRTDNPNTRMKVQKALMRVGPVWARQNYMGQETAGAIRKAAKLAGLVAVAGLPIASRVQSKGRGASNDPCRLVADQSSPSMKDSSAVAIRALTRSRSVRNSVKVSFSQSWMRSHIGG